MSTPPPPKKRKERSRDPVLVTLDLPSEEPRATQKQSAQTKVMQRPESRGNPLSWTSSTLMQEVSL